MSRPWMPLYVSDYLGDTRRLTTLEHGAYILLIMEYWQHGGLPNDDAELAEIAGLADDEWQRVRHRISRLFKDGWRHKRIDEELAKASEISERRKASAERRWSKSNANALQEHVTCNARAGVPQPQPQPQPQLDKRYEVSNETSTRSSPDDPGDAPQELKLVDLQKARRERTESDIDLLDGITDLWNAWARQHGSPLVERLTEKRAISCRRRIADLKAYGHDSPHEAFGFLLSKCSQSFYARGSPRKPLEFDQLMREDFMTRMLEGAFEHREAKRF